ncbi:MAG: hypothetical protein JO246_02085 [Frankiaceae bacterium]|nr:hypothetical protein [Frankiaceae bacterium]MBV9869618.1 hypothetical protein [Frankiaceae bacterium]
MRTSRSLLSAGVVASALTLVGSGAHAAGKGPRPGLDGPRITLARHIDMTAGDSDLVMSANGTAYAGWLGSPPGSTTRVVYACVLPPGAKGCKGGVQSTSAVAGATASDLHMVMRNGTPTLLWRHDTESSGAIAAAIINPAGVLSDSADVAAGPRNGRLLDAVVGPGNAIWTITYQSGLPQHIELHAGLTAVGTSIDTPWPVGYAQLAFAAGKPVVVATDYGAIGTPPAYSTSKGNGYTAFKPVKHTWAAGVNVGLTTTSSGLRLTAAIDNANYWPVVAKWNGHGFSHPTPTGDRSSCPRGGHDTSTEASGRLIDVANLCGKITVSSAANTTRAALIRFSAGGTVAGNRPQIVSSPRGHAWVMWGIEDSAAGGNGDQLFVAPVLLPDTHSGKKAHGKHGTVSVQGPTSCLPADRISVRIKANPDRGWKVASKELELAGKKVHRSINGASLKPGKKYALIGTAVFRHHGHEKVHAKLKFRSCPNP